MGGGGCPRTSGKAEESTVLRRYLFLQTSLRVLVAGVIGLGIAPNAGAGHLEDEIAAYPASVEKARTEIPSSAASAETSMLRRVKNLQEFNGWGEDPANAETEKRASELAAAGKPVEVFACLLMHRKMGIRWTAIGTLGRCKNLKAIEALDRIQRTLRAQKEEQIQKLKDSGILDTLPSSD